MKAVKSRPLIEKEITRTLKVNLKNQEFKSAKSDILPNNYFYKQFNNKILWIFSFYLYNKNHYSCSLMAGINYVHLTKIIKDLLDNNPEANFFNNVGISTHKFSSPIISISTIEEVSSFVNRFIERLDAVKESYWNYYSDIGNTIKQFNDNPIDWPIASLSQYIAHSVAYGIDCGNDTIAEVAIDNASKLLVTNNYERDRDFVNAVIKAFKQKWFLTKKLIHNLVMGRIC
jgi:hypothetical protein